MKHLFLSMSMITSDLENVLLVFGFTYKTLRMLQQLTALARLIFFEIEGCEHFIFQTRGVTCSVKDIKNKLLTFQDLGKRCAYV